MTTTITENVGISDKALRVDRARCIIHNVKLLGFKSKNGRTYTKAAVENAIPLYEGARVNVNHPKDRPDAPRGYQDRLGRVRQTRIAEDGLRGDLHYNPKHPIAEQLLWDCEHSPDSMGLSHNVDVDARRGEDGGLLIESISKVRSVDLVADPATTQSIYESEGKMSVALSAIVAKVPEAHRLSLQEFIEANGDMTLGVDTPDQAVKMVEALMAGGKAGIDKSKDSSSGDDSVDDALKSVLERLDRSERRNRALLLLTEAEIPPTDALLEQLSKLEEADMRSHIADLPPSLRHRSRPVVEFTGSTPGGADLKPAADMKDLVARCKSA